jgi:hypothetical protein
MLADVAAAEPSKARKIGRSEVGAAAVPASRLGDASKQNTAGVISGNISGMYLAVASDLSDVLDDGDNLRILPIIGKGGGQNIRDVRFLRASISASPRRTCSTSIAAPTRSVWWTFLVKREGAERGAAALGSVVRGMTTEEREQLFREFLQWNGARESR